MKYIKLLIFVITGAMFVSCDTDEFLNPLPDTSIVSENFFQSDDDVLSGIIGVYDAIQGVNENTQSSSVRFNRGVQLEYLLTEHRSDNTRSKTLEGSRADFHRYIVEPENIQSEDYYQSMYEIIFRANNVLKYVDNADAANINKYTAEAKFLRAYAYFNLVRLYGDVPLLTRVASSDEKELLYTRVDVAKVYEQIVSDLKEGVSYLDNSHKSRASKAAAQGILAKVYLSQPSPNYSGAKALCEAIMGSGFSLQSNFSDVFYKELNSEIIFAIEYIAGDPNESQGFSSEFTSFKRQGRQDGLNIVNPNLAVDFIAHGGNRTTASYAAFGDDVNLPVPLDAEIIKFLPFGSNISDRNLPTYGEQPGNAGNDWIILRYSDVLLMHAEAIMQGNPTNDTSAIDSYMKVKVRAGFDAVADRPSALTVDALLLERRVELAFENHRFFDLVRLGVAHQVLGAHATLKGYTSYNVRRLLLPIPSREINLSEGLLTQNPQ
ncbi:SusD-like starch-binding protein associating with outer membrane [Lutibacter sp. Hel_I_33_5]|uniref:RagB/SusD family nutrient uptake outer membrane protein n=1 Tax=Lutibacter sp. Hel_I_33_5 TaxID=1566289 RepID=UPI0011A5BE84|nr:RagB/SusD family nutrient uptake outer membrane protein [Lutibacter sp. Hel_I_33_5]TVZ57325.1 SusD-like starch-binding protein associating with outer membrane [Lutibacter sp. Hel_I_33_5]